MSLSHSLALALAVSLGATPAALAAVDQHAGHHPAADASSSHDAPSTSMSDMAAMGKPGMQLMQSQLQTMQGMHTKMMAAKTPEERSALLAANMKAMQDGMSMLDESAPNGRPGMMCDMADHERMMTMRMQMMQAMMQMMMDRLPPVPAN